MNLTHNEFLKLLGIVIKCVALSDPLLGSVSVSGTVVGSTATYTCNHGTILIGDRRRVCEDSGWWSGSEPRCEGIIITSDASLPCMVIVLE